MGVRLENATRLYLEGIGDGDVERAIHTYAGDRYVQHSHPVKDGKQGFIDFFADFHRRFPERDIQVRRGFEDGRYVFLHATQSLNGGAARWITADIFDTDHQGRLIEHWDIIGPWVEDTASGHTQVDGPTEPTDVERTAENKDLVRRFVTDVLVDGHTQRAAEYLSAETIEHSPQIRDGLDGFLAHLRQSADRGQPMVYDQVHKVVGCGDLVAVLSAMRRGSTPYAVIDLFRVAGARIVEHWEVTEQIQPRDQWVNAGKF